MTMPGLPAEPFRVTCQGCGAEGFTFDGSRLDQAVTCACCPVDHEHSGECRPVTISATAVLVAEIQ